MSENTGNSTYCSPLTRRTGVGLTRTNLSRGKQDTSQRISRDTPLLKPSRLIISGSSLGPRRTDSDHYSSGYSRLGGLKNISAPNVSSYVSSDVVGNSDLLKPVKNNSDINQNIESPLRKNLSATNTSELLKSETVSKGVSVQRSESDSRGPAYFRRGTGTESGNRGLIYPSRSRETDRDSRGPVYPSRGTETDGKVASDYITQKVTDKNLENSDNGRQTDNYVLELEEDEEDAVVQVKDTVDGTETGKLEMSSLNSPSKDSGYHSPRIETNVDSLSTSVLGSRSPLKSDAVKIDSPKYSASQDNSSYVPERPVRSKHSAKKHSIDKPKLLSQAVEQSPWQQGTKSSIYDTPKTSEGHNDKTDLNNDLSKENSLPDVQRSGSQFREESMPVAKPRTHRRLTRRSISFKRLEDDEYIGFASLPEQVHRKAVRRGFEFTLMVVGETGLGKSTLINSLFLTDLYKDRKVGNIEERIQKTVELEKKELEIEERGVKLKLTIVDTPGFCDAVNAEESWKPIVNYIDKQFEGYFTAESGLNRKNIQDTRVHCCLYFISPYGHGLRPVDVMVMKKLHHKVNIIPLIAKSDMLTKQEVKKLKERVLLEIQKHNIQIYQYPDCDSDEDEEFKLQDKELKKSIPFAVVGSNTVVEAGGRKIRGRMYPWGIVEVENPVHSDFTKLRQMLISTHMQDLKDVTCDVHYENYRAEHISEQMTTTQRERGKLKRDSAANLESSLATEKLLQEKEAEIRRMQEMLVKMQAQLQNNNSPRPNGRVGHV